MMVASTCSLSLPAPLRNLARTCFSPSLLIKLTCREGEAPAAPWLYGIHWNVSLSTTTSPSMYISVAPSADKLKVTVGELVYVSPSLMTILGEVGPGWSKMMLDSIRWLSLPTSSRYFMPTCFLPSPSVNSTCFEVLYGIHLKV